MIEVDLQIDDEFMGKVDAEALCAAVEETLQQQGVERAGLTIVITDDATVHELNRTFRDVDGPTDILSFPNHETAGADASEELDHALAPQLILPPELIEAQISYLGDLIISFPYTQRQAASLGRPLDAELVLLVIHGALHLLGHDHADAAEEAAMWAQQNQVLAALGYAPVTP
ncbi:MAG: rRNA maturation RNase YbeY [Caldilineaceae bacterium]